MKKVVSLAVVFLMILLSVTACFGPDATPTPVIPTPKPTKPAATPTTPPQPSYLLVETTPLGAMIEVGIQGVGDPPIMTPGTGRIVGTSPIKVMLKESDIHIVNGYSSITIMAKLQYYYDNIFVVGLGSQGKLVPGKTYEAKIKLNRIG